MRLWAVPKWLLPAPSVIAMTLVVSWELLLDHALVTLVEVVVGFALALLCGVLLACGIAASRTLERALYPFVIASQMVPIIVIAPLLLIWVGYGLTPKIIVVALTAFFPIVVNMVDGLQSVDPDAVNLLRTMGASRWLYLREGAGAYLPALPVLRAESGDGSQRHWRGYWRVGGLQPGTRLSDDPLQAPVSH